MSRKRSVFPYSLDSGDIQHVSTSEIALILRAADSLIGSSGRTVLAKILKGSKDKRVLLHGLDDNPTYGALKDQSLELITNKIDWCIKNRYLYIDYDGRMPVLHYTETGWDIERETFAEELFQEMLGDIKLGRTTFIERMLRVNPACVLLALGKLDVAHNPGAIAVLNEWLPRAEGKVKKRLRSLLATRA
jgi:superfamily II DNA helicase RecQ